MLKVIAWDPFVRFLFRYTALGAAVGIGVATLILIRASDLVRGN